MKPKRTAPPAKPVPDDDAYAPTKPVDLEESVAGEEDPGASFDLLIDTPAAPDPGAAKPKPKR